MGGRNRRMPTYIYHCDNCNVYIEQFAVSPKEKIDDDKMFCTTCKSLLRRIYNIPAVLYKTNGFYTTDNKEKNN